jgi:hypothetical protein
MNSRAMSPCQKIRDQKKKKKWEGIDGVRLCRHFSSKKKKKFDRGDPKKKKKKEEVQVQKSINQQKKKKKKKIYRILRSFKRVQRQDHKIRNVCARN